MIKKTLFLFFIVSSAHAMSFKQTSNIYNRLSDGHGPRLEYSSSGEFNAYNNGETIVVMQGLMSRVNTNEMAFVLGHELGHSHGNGSGWSGEYGADRYGVRLATSKGYNACAAAKSFFKKLPDVASSDHPSPSDRIKHLGC